MEEGAIALFGEKYGDEVRVVSFGEDTPEGVVSMELCGGTHVDCTAEVGNFRVVNESGVAAGVRRIEVLTGHAAETLVEQRFHTLECAADILHTKPDELENAVQQLFEQNQQLHKELAQLRQALAQQNTQVLLGQAAKVNDVSVLAAKIEASDVDTMRQMTDWLRDHLGSSVVVIGAIINDKPQLVAAVTQDLVKRGLHAGQMMRAVAKIIGGGGGGGPQMAQAGGKDVAKLTEALQHVSTWVEQSLK